MKEKFQISRFNLFLRHLPTGQIFNMLKFMKFILRTMQIKLKRKQIYM